MTSSDIVAAFRWWLILALLGISTLPITLWLFRRLPDRGYALSKLVGILAVSYLFWLMASLGFLNNTAGGVTLALVVVTTISLAFYIYRGGWHSFLDNESWGLAWLRRNLRYILLTEILFAVLFALWVWVRAQNPAITATEKPMEFAFLNAASRSPTYPPLDPWMSGFAISYYYFGYVMSSVLVRLSGVPEAIGFNLSVAWLLAGTGVAAFGVVSNLLRASRLASRRTAYILGLVACLALPIAGNLEILLEVAHANGLGSNSFWTWLDIRDLEPPAVATETPRYQTSQWWWWRSSRVIREYHLSGVVENNLEPIAEFPGFSFVLGDLHPHVLALPFAFLSLSLAFSWWSTPTPEKYDLRFWRRNGRFSSGFRQIPNDAWLFLLFSGLILGGLAFLNTWDVLIHLFLVSGAYALAIRRKVGHWSADVFSQSFLVGCALAILSFVLYLPFYIGFRSQAGAPFILPLLMRPTRLAHYLVIFGLPLSSLVLFLLALSIRSMRQTNRATNMARIRQAITLTAILVLGLFALLFVMAWIYGVMPAGSNAMMNLANQAGANLASLDPAASPIARFSWSLSTVFDLTPLIIGQRLTYIALTLFLSLLLATVIFLLSGRRIVASSSEALLPDSATSFVLLLVLLGTLLSLGPEYVYLRDNFGQRLNTIFKFYYQTWVMFGVAGLFGLGYLISRHRITSLIAAPLYGILLVGSLLFPVHAIASRAIEYRGPVTAASRIEPTLDGLAHIRSRQPDEYDALRWLQANTDPTTIIAEAVGGSYTGFGRMSANSGRAAVIGWPGHELQWRGATDEPGNRKSAIESLYTSSRWPEISDILDRYEIDLVIYGPLEISTYGEIARRPLEESMLPIYRNNSVTIYGRR